MIQIENPNTGKAKTIKTTNLHELNQKIDQLKSNKTWELITFEKRFEFIELFKRELLENRSTIQRKISKETGKPLWESLTEVNASIHKIENTLMSFKYRCNYPSKKMNNKTIETKTKPIGIIAIIGPFNFPMHIPNGQIVPALLSGNKIIVKSSIYTTETTRFIEKLWKKVFKLIDSPIEFIYGDKTTGKAVVSHLDTDAVFFTGSSAVGMKIKETCYKLKKPCALEMGGNNALIVEDVSDELLNHLTISSFITAGQRCTSARRIIINKKYEYIINEWINHLKKLTIATYPSNIIPFMGPVVLPDVKHQILTKKIPFSETILKSNDLGKGGLISPRLNYSKQLYDHEIFGPMAFIYLSESIDESIEMVNQSKYGLSCSIYTKTKKTFEHAFNQINCGVINWNCPTTGASGIAPFGGTKESGNHKPGGFNMIDHCVIPVASSQQKRTEKIEYPGLNA